MARKGKATDKAALLESIRHLPVVDSHEHVATEAEFVSSTYDFTDLMCYLNLDLGMAGFPVGPWGGRIQETLIGQSIDEKWRRIEPYWPFVRTGSFARAYRRMLKTFFGVGDLDIHTVHDVTDRIPEYQHKGVYDKYLHKQYGIQTMVHVQNHQPTPEPEHFAPVLFVDGIAGAWRGEEARQNLGADLPHCYADFEELVREHVVRAVNNGIVGLKIGRTARRRPLDFQAHTDYEVQTSYNFLCTRARDEWEDPATRAKLKAYQDATYWALFELAGELGVPVQIHSGLEFMQPWHGRPSVLIPTLLRFPETRFLLFHGSYPFMDELTGLARSFPNVYLDLAWLYLLSDYQARAWLAEWLDVVPHNKIIAFGGDVHLFFTICTHLEMAQEAIADVLADRIQRGHCGIDEALYTAQRILHDNAWEVFDLGNRCVPDRDIPVRGGGTPE